MNKYLKLSIGLYFLVLLGCTESDFTENIPDTPDAIDIDIDEDGNLDFRVEYSQVLIESPFSDGGIVGKLAPLNENEVLTSREERNLFLRDLDIIKETVSEPFFWNDKALGQTIVSITNNIEQKWPSNWEIESDSEELSYFLGLKFKSGNVIKLGWIEIDINASNGNVEVMNKGIL